MSRGARILGELAANSQVAAAFPGNPVQNLNFVVTGILMGALAVRLRRGAKAGLG